MHPVISVSRCLILAASLLLLAATSAVAGGHMEKNRKDGVEHHVTMLSQWLKLDPDQQAQVTAIYQDVQQQLNRLQSPDWLSVITADAFYEDAADRQIALAQQNRRQHQLIMLRAQHRLYHQVLNPAQQASYRERMQQWRPGTHYWKMKGGQMRRFEDPVE